MLQVDPRIRPIGLALAVVAVAVGGLTSATALQPAPLSEPGEGYAGAGRPAFETMPSVEATFLRDSYRPGDLATLVLWRPYGAFTLRLYRIGPRASGRWRYTTMQGAPVSPLYRFGPTRAHHPIHVPIGNWASGVYFARLQTRTLVGFAPVIVRPRRLGEHRVAVVEPTYTWQAYNFRDDDRDRRGDTWYAATDIRSVELVRPYLARGVPFNFTIYDLPFLQWMERTGKTADFLSDADLASIRTGAELRRHYRLVIFPGHHEYVTGREFNVTMGYRSAGGHLMFLTANNFFWKVDRQGSTLKLVKRWRDLGRPEAELVGVQYLRNDNGEHQAQWRVLTTRRLPWLFRGTGLKVGSPFGYGGVEIDHIAQGSPANVTVVASMPDVMGPGYTAQMTYYETPSGAKVFAAGAFTLAGMSDPISSRVLGNLWTHLASTA